MCKCNSNVRQRNSNIFGCKPYTSLGACLPRTGGMQVQITGGWELVARSHGILVEMFTEFISDYLAVK